MLFMQYGILIAAILLTMVGIYTFFHIMLSYRQFCKGAKDKEYISLVWFTTEKKTVEFLLFNASFTLGPTFVALALHNIRTMS